MKKGIIVHSIIASGGKFLIIKRAQENNVLSGFWDTPGGTLEDGEDPAMGAQREALEETGLILRGLSLFFYHSNIDETKNKQFITLVFMAKTSSDIPNIKLNPREHEELCWVNIDTVENYKLVPWLEKCARYIKEKEIKI